MSGIYQPVATGTIAAADIVVTLTAGSADVDLSSATIPRNYKGHLIKIYDANNVCIQGYVYTDGAGTVQNIVSAKGGTTRNWAQQGAGFDDTTNCRYEIYRVLQAVVIATHNISAYNALMDTTTANAFAAPVGVDLSPYHDGKHILALYDASGYAAAGWISATAPSGYTLGAEKHDDTGFDDAGKWVTGAGWSVSGSKAVTVNARTTVYQSNANMLSPLVDGELYISTFTISSYTSGSFYNRLAGQVSGAERTGTGTFSDYLTANAAVTGSGIIGDSAIGSCDDKSLKKVTMPAATGALLLSSRGGSRGYIYKNASFNPNAALTAKILYVGD